MFIILKPILKKRKKVKLLYIFIIINKFDCKFFEIIVYTEIII